MDIKRKKFGFLGFASTFRVGQEANYTPDRYEEEDSIRKVVGDYPWIHPIFLKPYGYDLRVEASHPYPEPESPGIAPIHLKPYLEVKFLIYYQNIPRLTTRLRVDDKSLKAVVDRIKDVKRHADFLAVGIHWGLSYRPLETEVFEFQPSLAHTMIDAGADVVAGHHPHRAHGVEIYRGRPIFYSLGNLIFPVEWEKKMYGVDYREQILARVKLDGTDIAEIELIPYVRTEDLSSIGDIRTRDNMLRHLMNFEEIYQFGTEYTVRGDDISIIVSKRGNR